jgi:hypothetical protein
VRYRQDVREELRQGRRSQVYATFTGEFDVAARLESVLRNAGLRVAVLRPTVPTLKRELWYEKQLKEGVQVVICHPKLVETGLDLLALPDGRTGRIVGRCGSEAHRLLFGFVRWQIHI